MASSVATSGVEHLPKPVEEKSGGTPKITRKLRGKNAKPGNQVVLSCSASTDDNTKVTWFKNGAELSLPIVTSQEDEKKHRVHLRKNQDDMELVVNNAHPDDAGYYMFVASNSCGEASSMAELSVR